MTEIRIDASATSVGKISKRASVASGSPAPQAYDRAVKQFSDAQEKLSQDVIDRAPEATIKVDQAMVQAAALAVAAATATLSREQATSQSAETPSQGPVKETENPRPDRYRLGDVDLHA